MTGRDDDVTLGLGPIRLGGHLTVPGEPAGIVVFAHGSGSSRHSIRNRLVASALNAEGLATMLFDLLTPDEEIARANVFDIELLTDRVGSVVGWVRNQSEFDSLPIGLFGASTGSAAALCAAAEPDSGIAAVVSRGGRPDLAGACLRLVRAPTLLIVGGADTVVLDLNRRAQHELRCENRLDVVPGASHLFEETGALGAVAELSSRWFVDHLAPVCGGRQVPGPNQSPG